MLSRRPAGKHKTIKKFSFFFSHVFGDVLVLKLSRFQQKTQNAFEGTCSLERKERKKKKRTNRLAWDPDKQNVIIISVAAVRLGSIAMF